MWCYVVLVFTALVLFYHWKCRKLISFSKQFKTSLNTIPFFGSAHLLLGSDEDIMNVFQMGGRDAIAQNGIISVWIAHRLYIVVADAENANFIVKFCLEKDDIMQICFKMIIGNGSIAAPVHIWRSRRRILLPNFSSKNLNQFVNVFAKQSYETVQQLQKNVGVGSFSIYNYIGTFTLTSIFETTLGVNVKDHISPKQLLYIIAKGLNLIATRALKPWLYNDFIFKFTTSFKILNDLQEFINNFTNKILRSKRKAYEEKQNGDKGQFSIHEDECFKSLLDLLIESSGGKLAYTDTEIQEEFIVLIVAATDTTAISASFVMLMLASYPEVQERVYSEIKEVFGVSTRPAEAEDLPKLKYLEMVIKETLRLYPPVPIILRKIEKDITLPSGTSVPEGCGAVVNIWALHRNPQYWGDDAEQFYPERFLKPFRHPAQFMAFSYGPRNCAGYQYAMSAMKTLLSTILRHYQVLSPKKNNSNQPEPRPYRVKFRLLMRDVDDFMIELQRRE